MTDEQKKKLPKGQLPTQTIVLGVPFRVVTEKDMSTTEDAVGDTDGQIRRIRVCDTQDKRRRWTTFSHEWFHAVLHVVGIGNILDEGIEEVIVQSMEHGLEQFILQHGKEYFNAIGAGNKDE